MMLEEVCSCSIIFRSYRWLLWLGLGLVLLGFFAGSFGSSGRSVVLAFLTGAAALAAFWFTRHEIVTIASAGDQIIFNTNLFIGLDTKEFVDRLESAKNERLEHLFVDGHEGETQSCSKCGERIEEDAVFCSNCGHRT